MKTLELTQLENLNGGDWPWNNSTAENVCLGTLSLASGAIGVAVGLGTANPWIGYGTSLLLKAGSHYLCDMI